MALFNSIHSSMWEDDKFRKLADLKSRLLFIYAFTNHRCSVSGIYKISIETMSFELGFSPDCITQLQEVIDVGLVSYDFNKNVIWVHGKMKFDKSWRAKMRLKSIQRSIDEFSKCSFMSDVYSRYPFLIELALESDKRMTELRGSLAPEVESALEAEEAKEEEIRGSI